MEGQGSDYACARDLLMLWKATHWFCSRLAACCKVKKPPSQNFRLLIYCAAIRDWRSNLYSHV